MVKTIQLFRRNWDDAACWKVARHNSTRRYVSSSDFAAIQVDEKIGYLSVTSASFLSENCLWYASFNLTLLNYLKIVNSRGLNYFSITCSLQSWSMEKKIISYNKSNSLCRNIIYHGRNHSCESTKVFPGLIHAWLLWIHGLLTNAYLYPRITFSLVSGNGYNTQTTRGFIVPNMTRTLRNTSSFIPIKYGQNP